MIQTGIGNLNIIKYFGGKENMARVSKYFSNRSNGILKGGISALDGWFVRVVKSGWCRDACRNPTTCFSKKGVYALNVQFIVDDRKSSVGYLF